MSATKLQTRRDFIAAGAVGIGLLVAGPGGLALAAGKPEAKAAEVGPAEDLMREHGVLRRVLLIYEEAVRRLDAGDDLPAPVLAAAARLIQRFIENYHEKLEENELFPRFKKSGRLVDLTQVLYDQHRAGRGLTVAVLQAATPAGLADAGKRGRVGEALRRFIRMYRPHAAREDTVLFPAFRTMVSAREYDVLGDKFEAKEHELFGQDGFEKIVNEVADLEKALGVYDLSQFTPKP